jgi:hypothetical protein
MSSEATTLSPEYMNRSDKIEIHKWLDGELGDFPFGSGRRRLLAIGQEIEQSAKTPEAPSPLSIAVKS